MESLFNGTATQRLLTFLAGRPSQVFFVRELPGASGISLGAAHAAVHALADAGLLRKETRGRRCFYGVDRAHPLVRQWKVLMTVAALEPVLKELRGLSERIVLYGSRATGDDREDSDIDLYVRTAQPDAVMRAVDRSGVSERIQLVARTVVEEAETERANPVFLENVRRGLVLYDGTSGF